LNKNKEKRNRTIQTKQGNNYNTMNVVSYTRVYQCGYQELSLEELSNSVKLAWEH